MRFTKMQGLGNDYVYVNCFEEVIDHPEQTARFVSDRHFGIGADGLILIAPSKVADVRMIMFNADGSRAMMCGNGVRCVGKYAFDHHLARNPEVTVETDSGIKTIQLQVENGIAVCARVDMGTPIITPKEIPMHYDGESFIAQRITVGGQSYRGTAVSMGNPHLVIPSKQIESLPLSEIGPLFEHHTWFPNRVNTEFIEICSPSEINMRVWERGSGETLACGTGACACVVAGVLEGTLQNEVLVHLLGGDLRIEYDTTCGRVFMTGPAVTVFSGEI